ncbi:MAG: TonB-dependent receptor [Bacteroidia bacterium]|nr:TonB-dependent receptor [Bacteroidia bacterium]MDW8015249.1 TonB-dependent receptor [Bacteroidia bacterium]
MWRVVVGLLSFTLYAQSSLRRYRIVVRDAQTQEALVGATVVPLKGGLQGALTDSLGVAVLALPASAETLWIEVRYMGYEPYKLPVTARTAPLVEAILKPEGVTQEAVVITAAQESRTEVALLSALHQLPQIATGLSAQIIQQTPDRTAAAVLSRVTGVSLNDGRFLVIRGMNERYNSVLLNRLPAPSTEPDSRAFDLELFPAGIIDQVRVYKTPSAHQSGDFGGGLVEIITRRSSDKPAFHVQSRVAYIHGTTFQSGVFNIRNPSDLWGGGVTVRALPSGFPPDLNGVSLTESQKWMLRLPPNFQSRRVSSVGPGGQLSFSYGLPLSPKFWFNLGVAYSRSFQTMRIRRNRYEVLVLQPGVNAKLFSYEDFQTTQMMRAFGFANFLWMPAPGHQIELSSFAARLTEDETIIREGFSFYQRGAEIPFRNYSMQYLARTLATLQTGGTHRFSERVSLRWDVGGNATLRDEPDYRRVRTVLNTGDTVYRIVVPPGPTTFDAARFFSQLRQFGGTAQLALLADIAKWKWVSGFQVERITRDYWARWFSYTIPSTASPAFVQYWTALPIEQAFQGENLNGLRLREGTNPTDKYAAEQIAGAAYISAERRVGPLSFHGGLRYEYTEQRLKSATATAPVDVKTPFPLLMPFLNLGYMLTDNHKLRLAYSRTLNRPALRELAPFLYYNFALEVQQAGNPSLRPASLDNLDVRYELTPSLDQLIAVGTFYKHIRNPIETYILRGADQPTVVFGNAPTAHLIGVEGEVRLRLGRRWTLLTNAAYIWSQVDMGAAVEGSVSGTPPSQARFRPLQGQAPYLLNMIIFYQSLDGRWEAAHAAQLIGPRLWWVGDNFNPSIFEMPRPVWDISLRRLLGKRFYLQFQIRDLLNTPFVYRQDSDLNGRISRREDIIFRFVRGSEWSLTVGWKL